METLEAFVTVDDEKFMVICDWSGNVLEIFRWGPIPELMPLKEITPELEASISDELARRFNG